MIIHRKAIVPLSRLLVLSKEGDDISELDVSISAEEKNVSFISEKLQGFLTEKGVDSKTAFKTALCTEEIAADYIAHRNSNQLFVIVQTVGQRIALPGKVCNIHIKLILVRPVIIPRLFCKDTGKHICNSFFIFYIKSL